MSSFVLYTITGLGLAGLYFLLASGLSLIFGLLFLGVAGWWAASYYFDWSIRWYLLDAGWLLAGGLILLGLIGILASLGRDRRDAGGGFRPRAGRPLPALQLLRAGGRHGGGAGAAGGLAGPLTGFAAPPRGG